jgi:hypothetical protein
MIAIDPKLYAQLMRVLRQVEWTHPDAHRAADRLMLAGLESATREIEFNEPSALLRKQA